jgi:lipoate-protein ligase B
MTEVTAISLGVTKYKPTWELQQKVFGLRLGGKLPDVLLLNEHNHVYTFGKSGDEHHLLAQEAELREKGIDVYHIDRGGDVTYHGPGQLVGYPIIDLNNYYPDVHRYLRDIEEVIIRTLADFYIVAHRDEGLTGVWVGENKIAAIGVKASHWITMHGFALNVNTDLSYFDRIIPCGIFHKGVTSMQRVLGEEVSMSEVTEVLIGQFGKVFGTKMTHQDGEEFIRIVEQLAIENFEWLQTANR